MNGTREFTSVGKPIVNTVTTIEYRLWQRSLDARWGNSFFNDWRGHYLDELSADAIRILIDHVEQLNSPWTDIRWNVPRRLISTSCHQTSGSHSHIGPKA